MTPAQVFSSALLLKSGDRTEQILALLDERKLEEVKSAVQKLSSMPLADVRQLWNEEREAEERVATKAAEEKFGFEAQQLAPALVNWLVLRAG